jgi:hypothetical protein
MMTAKPMRLVIQLLNSLASLFALPTMFFLTVPFHEFSRSHRVSGLFWCCILCRSSWSRSATISMRTT